MQKVYHYRILALESALPLVDRDRDRFPDDCITLDLASDAQNLEWGLEMNSLSLVFAVEGGVLASERVPPKFTFPWAILASDILLARGGEDS